LVDPQWLSIQGEFEELVLPRLSLIRQFFDGDSQLSVLEGRIGSLSQALAVSERLAFDRLDQVLKLDSQLKKTSGALAFAEQLALHRQQMLEHAEQPTTWSHDKAILEETVKQLSFGLERCEALALERLAVIERLDAQLHATGAALAHAEQCVVNMQSTQVAVQERRIADLETLAHQRLEQMQALDEQVGRTTEGLVHARQIVEEQACQLSSQRNQIQDLERLALQRQAEIELLGRQHLERERALSAGLAQAEQFAFSRLEQINRLNEELKQVADSLAQAQRLVATHSVSQET
jgi:hypothetical protein